MSVRLLPMVDWIGDFAVEHGERGSDLDPEHPMACLCGVGFYLDCERYANGDGIQGWTLYPAEPPSEARTS